MPTLENVKLDALFSMFKGEPGTRKSTAALSYPTPQYWISTDQKMEALMLPAKRWGVSMRDINYDDYTDWDKPKSQLERMQVNCPYKTIIVDSVTSIGDCINRQTRRFKQVDGKGKSVGGISTNSIEDYMAEATAFQELIAILKDIHKFHNVHVILVAHVVGQRKDSDDNKLTHHSRVIITGGDKISGKIASYMTEVYHFNIKAKFEADKEGEYGLLTVHTGNDFARTSLPLPSEILFNSEPLYEKWIAPAINKLKAEKPIERIKPQPIQSTPIITQTPFVQPQQNK